MALGETWVEGVGGGGGGWKKGGPEEVRTRRVLEDFVVEEVGERAGDSGRERVHSLIRLAVVDSPSCFFLYSFLVAISPTIGS